MTFAELRDKIVAAGIESVKTHETRPEKIRGCLAGFEALSKMESYQAIKDALQTRHIVEREMLLNDIHTDKVEEWWEHRCFTNQLEHAVKIFDVGLRAPILSGRAIMQYAKLVGTTS